MSKHVLVSVDSGQIMDIRFFACYDDAYKAMKEEFLDISKWDDVRPPIENEESWIDSHEARFWDYELFEWAIKEVE